MKKNDPFFIDYCTKLGIPSDWLWQLIYFESRWNPLASNRLSSAKGLIQFTDNTAITLGYTNSLDLINKNPDIKSQLLFPVKKYLEQYKPFPTKQSLYMAVFYPKARFWDEYTMFPFDVRKVNPGINTVSDYIRKVDNTKDYTGIVVVAVLFFLTLKKVVDYGSRKERFRR